MWAPAMVLFTFVVAGRIRASLHGRLPSIGAGYVWRLGFPGATVTVTHGAERFSTVSDQAGVINCRSGDGPWTVEISMLCFAPPPRRNAVSATTAAGKWNWPSSTERDDCVGKILPLSSFPCRRSSFWKKADPGAPAEIPKPRRIAPMACGEWNYQQGGYFEVLARPGIR